MHVSGFFRWPKTFERHARFSICFVSILSLFVFSCGRTGLFSLASTAPPFNPVFIDAGILDSGREIDAGVIDAGTQIDAGTPNDAGIPISCAQSSGPTMLMPCSVVVRVLSLVPSMPSCFIDTPFAIGSVGTLRWDCGSDFGGAEVVFAGRGKFVGVFSKAQGVNVCFGTTFPWSDGCQWTSSQNIVGNPQGGGRLQMTYGEGPIPGQSGCVVPCSASGELEVLP
jgi:hypothetical protein